jgi:hypothetical protein
MRKCSAKRAAEVAVEYFAIWDFMEYALTPGNYAYDVVTQGWGSFDMNGSCSFREFAGALSGLDCN